MTLNEVAPPGWGHTKAEKEKTKPDKPKAKIGGSDAAFKRALDDGRFKGLPGDKTKKEKTASMFKLMWSMKKKGAKPHYKPGTDKKYKKYQEEGMTYQEAIDAGWEMSGEGIWFKEIDGVNEGLTPMQDNNLFGNAYAGSYEDLKKKIGSKKKHNKPAIKESKEPKGYERFMADAQAARDRQAQKIKDRKEKDAQYVETKSKGVRFYDKKGKGRIKSGKKIYDK